MLESMPISGWELTGWGLTGLWILALLTGRIATRREVDSERARADTWQDAWEASRAANREKDEAIAELLQHSRTTIRVLRAMQTAAGAPEEIEDPGGSS